MKDTFSQKNIYDKWASLLLMLFIVATVVYIFSNSLMTSEVSKAQSTEVKEQIVEPILEPIVGEGNVTDHMVRKLAHLTEFGILGFELALLLRKWFLPSFFLTLLIAVADETLQIYSDRGPLLTDVWLDFFGACFGFAIGIGLVTLVRIGISAYKKKKIASIRRALVSQ